MEQYTKIDKTDKIDRTDNEKGNTMQNVKYGIYTMATGIFVAAAYYLPTDTFFGFLTAGLFIIPAAIFVEMIQKMKKVDDTEGGM